ncbi:DUF721 domain-containing protein [Flavobacterium lindanitolerans]|jgi:hypothetical protein|uniref:Uncharacterized protein DUF721 n=1 Tax=Flavobacterium lindanitolerans TaxID=428988 RepID=A0A497UU71_9FLAO|nr:DUF721 domain-containing protein [Flavobacterium lindanitolerans]PZO25068.1 MAG: DUF721 domain-containing protein [Flavobacteriaceae bacterium]PZQ84869.1 MAG: DUF721 domain-containing protein [Flavobacterium johnsoniae]MBC8645205.1 DUF721 domain-containing protein [Flavobacterium lindanitolerans]MBL7869921.1 DUF721 domain-containing protein [Flavobacterium lindanitolerans]MDQ7961903.1 DUF721 domain-containing protein [Flavobacterium lindanitolerans]
MAKRLNNENSVGDVLKHIIEANKLQPGIDRIAVKEAWISLMGNGVNSYTKDVVLRNNTLYVELTSAVLRQELSYGKEKIIKMINEEFRRDIVREIVFR